MYTLFRTLSKANDMKILKPILTFFVLFAFTIFPLHSKVETGEADRLDRMLLLEIVDILKKGGNIIFTKFGDGEHNCMTGVSGHNCDQDTYNHWMGNELKRSLTSLCTKKNVYIGKWHYSNVFHFCDQVASNHGVAIPWVSYHLFMNDDEFMNHDYMKQFVDFVTTTNRKKILICNGTNKRLTDFFRADIYIEIPPRNWSFEYKKWKDEVEKYIERDCVVLISAGMCSKILIDDITNREDVTCIDLGSSFDLLGSKIKSRPWQHSYEEELIYYEDNLPESWDS